MELNNLNIDSITASWFLLTLFYKTERKYTCAREKTLQLLTILALDYAYNGYKLFDEEILINGNGEAFIKGLMWLPNQEYLGMQVENDNKEYIISNLDESKDNLVPFMYRCNTVDDELKEKATNAFRKFGSYTQTDLVTMISPILNRITREDGVVELTNISSVVDEIKEENDVINYLKQNNLYRENKTSKRLIKR